MLKMSIIVVIKNIYLFYLTYLYYTSIHISCLIIKNNNYINGFIIEPIRHVVINPKNNIDKKFINIIIQSLSILFLEIILIIKTIICVTIQIGNINKTIIFTI